MKKISKNELLKIIKESLNESLLTEIKTLVDNFSDIAQEIDTDAAQLNDSDKFWYIEVKKRYKDNPGLRRHLDPKKGHNFDSYGLYIASFKVHNGQELLQLKPQITKLCNANNARAYITLNPRSDKAINTHIQSPNFQRYFKNRINPNAKPENVSAGRAVSFFDDNGKKYDRQTVQQMYGSDRPKFMFDIDEKDPRIWGLTRIVLNYFNIKIIKERKTPSGGLHIVCADAFDPNLDKALEYLRIFDMKTDDNGNRNYFPEPQSTQERRKQVVGCDYDGKELLYSNVDTKGY